MPRIRKVRVLSAALPITFLILAGTAYADPLLAESMGLDVWEIGRLEQELQTNRTNNDRLETDLVNLHELMMLNDLILADVAEGRVELSAAAKRKWELNRHRETVRDHLDLYYPGAGYEQKMAADICARVGHDCRNSPNFPATDARLRAEYRAAYHAPMPEAVR